MEAMKSAALLISLAMSCVIAKPSSTNVKSSPFVAHQPAPAGSNIRILEAISEENQLLAQQVQSLTQATNALYHEMKELKKQNVINSRTCTELMNFNPTLEEGMYLIDPDGWSDGDSPIYVHCSKSGVTSVPHDTEDKINVGHCYDPGCYSKAVTYNATMRQIRALIELSSVCEQSIRFDCTDAVLAFGGVQYAWWNDRDGKPRYYWSGSNDTAHTCACGIAGNCVETVVPCNCDAAIAVGLFDEGMLSKKDHLPVTRLNFGRTSREYTSGEHTLGRLSCSGSKRPADSSEPPTSCADLWSWGQTVSGLYLVEHLDARDGVITVFCDMTKLPGEIGQETVISSMGLKPSAVFFDATSTFQSWYRGNVTFNNTLLNLGDAFDETTGIFTAPVKGVYEFNVRYRTSYRSILVKLFHNEKAVIDEGTSYYNYKDGDNAAMQTFISLEVGDVVYVFLEQLENAYSSTWLKMQFTGGVIREL